MRWSEGGQYRLVVLAHVECDEVIRRVVPIAASCQYRGWVRIGVTGIEVYGLFTPVGGLPEAQHLVYLAIVLLEK